MDKYSIIFVTAPKISEARNIARALLKAKLVACVNIVSGVESLFWWQGKVDKARESLLVIKTRKKLFFKVRKLVASLHSYEVPEIISFSLDRISPSYRRWMDSVLKN